MEGMAGQISKHTVKPHVYAEIGTQFTSANKAACVSMEIQKLCYECTQTSSLSAPRGLSSLRLIYIAPIVYSVDGFVPDIRFQALDLKYVKLPIF